MPQAAAAGENRIDQNGDNHGPRAAQAIAENSENEAAGGPSQQEYRRELSAVFFDFFIESDFLVHRENRIARMRMKNLLERRGAHDVHQILIHRVEQPSQRRDGQNDPAVSIKSLV